MKILYLSLLSLLCTVSGCSDAPLYIPNQINNDIEEIVISQNYFKREFSEIKSLDFINLNVNNSSFASIYKFDIYKDHLYIYDNIFNQILIFDTLFNLRYTINDFGSQIGEFIDLSDFQIDRKANEIILLSNASNKLLFYNLKGNFLREMATFPCILNFCKSNSNYFFYNYYKEPKGQDFYVYRADSNMNITNYYFKNKGDSDFLFDFIGSVDNNDDIPLATIAFNDTMYSYKDDSFYPKYIIKFNPQDTSSRNIILTDRDAYFNSYRIGNNIFEKKNILLFNCFDTFGETYCLYNKNNSFLRFLNKNNSITEFINNILYFDGDLIYFTVNYKKLANAFKNNQYLRSEILVLNPNMFNFLVKNSSIPSKDLIIKIKV